MNIFNHYQHINLTNDQLLAVEKLNTFLQSDDRAFILKGYAGSGKTTLLKGLVSYLLSLGKTIMLMAPTGRAAKVINQKTGFMACTIHKGIYSFETLHEIKTGDDNQDVTFLYQYKLRNNKDMYDSILLVDEASMVSDALSQGEFFRFGSGYLLQDLIQFGRIQDNTALSKIVFIGDPAQLPPVMMNFSPALDSNYLREVYGISVSEADMKEVKRQESNQGILLAATKIRQCITSGFFNAFNVSDNNSDIFVPLYHDFLKEYKSQKDPKIILSHTNKVALDLNKTIREDKYGSDLAIQVADTVIIGGNNYRYGIMNGEFAVVSEVCQNVESREISFYAKGKNTRTVKLTWRKVSLVIPDENDLPRIVNGMMLENYLYGDNYLKPDEQRALYIDFKMRYPKLKKGTEEFKEALTSDPYFNCILLKFGYAVTCHKAQGGEWDNVFVFWDKGISEDFNFYESEHNRSGKTNADFYRWAYTAITRASDRLFCINPPRFSCFSEMSFSDFKVQEALNALQGKDVRPEEVRFSDVLPELQKFGLGNAPASIQDHYIQRLSATRKQAIIIDHWQRVGYEIRYVFRRESYTAAFMYWVNGQNIFKHNFQKINSLTNSDQLFETLVQIFENAQPVYVNRENGDANHELSDLDIVIFEAKPFLRDLFNEILKQLDESETIKSISHLEFKERYTFQKYGRNCVIDFEYNGEGTFQRVLPLSSKCDSIELQNRIKAIVNNLKSL